MTEAAWIQVLTISIGAGASVGTAVLAGARWYFKAKLDADKKAHDERIQSDEAMQELLLIVANSMLSVASKQMGNDQIAETMIRLTSAQCEAAKARLKTSL